ncbi:hypothetical protein [Desulfonema magnum]|uniref:Uncharacterized protein n=1 Tax=Desulfonema magnum TaxID=45655 RepID=A0A975BST3_9BACT|nr:hypothetical protein [Desulfonema magnum]QTA90812.1 Uncharacterized protein dnm_068740 [Desulfonema magnum]
MDALEDVIREERNRLSLAISEDEWDLLRALTKNKKIHKYENYHSLLRNLFVLEYKDDDGSWFDVNPVLAEAKELDR